MYIYIRMYIYKFEAKDPGFWYLDGWKKACGLCVSGLANEPVYMS